MSDNQKVKKIRAKVKLSQPLFALALNMKQGSISDIERGRTGVSNKLKKELEKVFYITSSYCKNDDGGMVQPGDRMRGGEGRRLSVREDLGVRGMRKRKNK